MYVYIYIWKSKKHKNIKTKTQKQCHFLCGKDLNFSKGCPPQLA